MSHNALDPNRMSATERLDELARILAAGLVRLRNRCSVGNLHDSNALREGSLDFRAPTSVHDTVQTENPS